MITIQKGKIFVPKDEELIGFAGDNAHKTVEFLISDSTQENWLYRIYLLFDDGTLNYFVIPALQTQQGTKLTWNVLEEHFLKGGIVKMQIKAFCNNSEIYHTNVTTLIVGDSIEFGDGFSKSANAEYLECEKKLNELYGKVVTQNGKPPYIGSNKNWYVYNVDADEFVDSGVTSMGEKGDKGDTGVFDGNTIPDYCITSAMIKNEQITTDKIRVLAVTTNKIADNAVTEGKLSDDVQIKLNYVPVIDSAMSDTSINAVQNKAVKAYVDGRIITTDKLANNAVTQDKIDSTYRNTLATKDYVSTSISSIRNYLPVSEISVTNDTINSTIDALYSAGVYNMINSDTLETCSVIVTSSKSIVQGTTNDYPIMQLYISGIENKYRAIDTDTYTWSAWVENASKVYVQNAINTAIGEIDTALTTLNTQAQTLIDEAGGAV